MRTYDFGDTVLVPFPFTDLPVAKRRPCVVLSSSVFNRANGQSVMGMITSAPRSVWTADIPISNLAAAGLSHSSFIRFKVFTLPNEMVLRPLGQLAQSDLQNLRACVAEVFS